MPREPAATIPLHARPLTLDDLADLDWAGEPHHLAHLAAGIADAGPTRLVLALVTTADLPRAIGMISGGDDQTIWTITDLSVHPAWQRLGLGTALMRELERAAGELGAQSARIAAEHDNPYALALYRRLGYRVIGSAVDSWPVGDHRRYVTVVSVLSRRLGESARDVGAG